MTRRLASLALAGFACGAAPPEPPRPAPPAAPAPPGYRAVDQPVVRALLTYSASSDSRSPAFADQTEMYGRKEWRAVRFTAADIAADPELRDQVVCSAGCDARASAR